MSDRMLVTPGRPGLKVLDPETQRHIPEESPTSVPRDNYWTRRLIDGDVTEVQASTEDETK